MRERREREGGRGREREREREGKRERDREHYLSTHNSHHFIVPDDLNGDLLVCLE